MSKSTRQASDRNLVEEIFEALKNIGKMLRPQELQPARIPEQKKPPAHRKKR